MQLWRVHFHICQCHLQTAWIFVLQSHCIPELSLWRWVRRYISLCALEMRAVFKTATILLLDTTSAMITPLTLGWPVRVCQKICTYDQFNEQRLLCYHWFSLVIFLIISNVKMVQLIWLAGLPPQRVDMRYIWEVLGPLCPYPLHHLYHKMPLFCVTNLDCHLQVKYMYQYLLYNKILLSSGDK